MVKESFDCRDGRHDWGRPELVSFKGTLIPCRVCRICPKAETAYWEYTVLHPFQNEVFTGDRRGGESKQNRKAGREGVIY